MANPYGPKRPSRFWPVTVAVGIAIVVGLLLTPVRLQPAPGDHEAASCGTAVRMDLSRWTNGPDGQYRDMAREVCTRKRITRIVWAALAASGTFASAAVALTQRRRLVS
jgi:multidrug efflux pump subunit AcrB